MDAKEIKELTEKLINAVEGIKTHNPNTEVTIDCTSPEGIWSPFIGKYVICRSSNEGINFGLLRAADSTGCVIEEARRLWDHKPADDESCWYEGVANHGISEDSSVSCAVPAKVIIEKYSLTLCTDKAVTSLLNKKEHTRSE